MTRTRKVSGVLAPVYGCLLLANCIVAIGGLHGPVAAILSIVFGSFGLAVGWAGRGDLEPWTPKESQDAAAGWGFVIAITLAGLAQLLPSPWNVVVAVAAVVATIGTVLAIRHRISSHSRASRLNAA